ncbi:hypothetical protein [Myceligenerans crystallogenes]|uniref:3-dehydroquinate dehydratase n=1 Tax=Myceligenerans crystallogenes TaxID=316335 RepID=A0ABN2N7Y9_9MICO
MSGHPTGATTGATTGPRVFVAGTMQGAGNGLDIADQTYRDVIRDAVLARFPDAECLDPGRPVQELVAGMAARPDEFAALAAQLGAERVDLDALGADVQRIRGAFREMTALAAECDLVIAYLPGTTPSMGTAMEMYQAYLAGVPVLAITEQRMNLSLLSTATWVISGLGGLGAWLERHEFHDDAQEEDQEGDDER